MSCDLCKQYTEMLPLPDDIIRVVQKFFGHPPHDKDDVMIYSSYVKIDYRKFEYKHDELLLIDIRFFCVDKNLIRTIIIENSTDMKHIEEERYTLNYNARLNAVCIINELQLKIDFEGRIHVRFGQHSGEIHNIDPDDVLIYGDTNNLLLDIDMSVY